MNNQQVGLNKRRGTVLISVGCVALAFVLIALLVLWRDHSLLRDQLAELTNKREALRAVVDRLPKEQAEREANKQIVHEVLRHCRAVDDIPKLGGSQIVSIVMFSEVFRIIAYVPAGAHKLEVKATWQKSLQNPSAADDADVGSLPAGQTWNVPLVSASGYILSLGKTGEEPLSWNVVGNHPDFQKIERIIRPRGFEPQGSASSTSQVFAFPNEVNVTRQQIATTNETPGVTLMDVQLRGAPDKQRVLLFRVRICSEGPRCLPASRALGLFMLDREDQLQRYGGGGKYDLKE